MQQRDAARRRRNLAAHHAAARERGIGHAPLRLPRVEIERRRFAILNKELRHVEADPARADHRDALADRLVAREHVDIGQHLRMILARNARVARRHARREHDVVVAGRDQLGRVDAAIQPQLHARELDLACEVSQRLVKLLLARNALGHVELAADLGRRVEQLDAMAALREHRRAREAGRPRADHRDALRACRARVVQLRFVACARIQQARRDLILERMIEACLIAADARVDLVDAAFSRLLHEFRIGEKRPRHRHHVRAAVRENLLGDFRPVDPVRRHERNADLALHLLRHPRKRAARHRGRDRRHARLVPADAGVDDRRARALDRLREQHDFVPVAAVGNQIEHRQPVDDDEIAAHRLARTLDDLDRQPHPVRVRAAPFVGALVRMQRDELVDQVAFGTHDLDAVVACLARELRAAHERANLPLDAARAQLMRRERRDRRFEPRRRDRERMIAVAAGMQDLQRDLAAVRVHRVRNHAMPARGGPRRQRAAERLRPAGDVRREAARDDQADAAARALGEIVGEARQRLAAVLETRVHRAHQHAVAQRREAEIERGEQVRKWSRHRVSRAWESSGSSATSYARAPLVREGANSHNACHLWPILAIPSHFETSAAR
ncbi:hypothetical protein DM46_2853 [Burkholderia mallei]|nr:hypothetical protein DM46_2853 [Burkholderia mallei]